MALPYKYLAVEGNIGAGKTTLAAKIAELTGGILITERFEENPFLKDFYQDIASYSLRTELFFLHDRFEQLKQVSIRENRFVTDFTIFKTKAFAEVTLSHAEYVQFEQKFNRLTEDLPAPDLIIHLRSETSYYLKNIKNRGRLYEQQINEDYLNAIESGYQRLWNSHSGLNILVVEPEILKFPYSNELIKRFLNSIGNAEFKGVNHFTDEHW